METGAWWRDPLRRAVDGRRVIIAGGPAAAWTTAVDTLRSLGAEDVLVYATQGRGISAQPDAQVIAVERAAEDFMSMIRAAIDAIGDPPDHVVAAIEAFDPDGESVVFGAFLNESSTLAGRDFVAYRRPEWVALEDKMRFDELLDQTAIPQLTAALMPVDVATDRWRALDDGDGTVWSGDARDGWHGGASRVRWVTDDDEAREAAAELSATCDRVRITPFREGVPCSIHGIVLDDGTASLRPVEMVTPRRGRQFFYSGCATFWDPSDSVRDTMRDAARELGEVLRRTAGFRGAFTLDGVVDADGFWPTELNPRFGAGLSAMMRGVGEIPLTMVLDLVAAGQLAVTPAELERTIVPVADSCRWGAAAHETERPITPLDQRPVRFDGDCWVWAGDGEAADGVVGAGERVVRLAFDPERTPVGPSVAERAVRFFAFADEHLGTAFGPLVPAG